MPRFFPITLAASLSLLATVFSISPSQAATCVQLASCMGLEFQTQSLVQSTAQATTQTLSQKIEEMQRTVSEAVHRAREEIVQAIATSTTSITKSVADNSTSVNKQAGDLERARDKRNARKSRGIDANVKTLRCNELSPAMAPRGGGASLSKPASGSRSDYKPSKVDPRWKNALAIAGATAEDDPKKKVPPISQEIQAANVGVGGCKTWADPKSLRGIFCNWVGLSKDLPNPYVDADVRAETLFDGPQKLGDAVKKMSIPPMGEERDARVAYLMMLNNPIPPSSPRSASMKSSEGSVYMARRAEYDAAVSLAAYPSFEWDRLTSSLSPERSKSALEAVDSADKDFLVRYFNEISPTARKEAEMNGVSPLQLLDIEVERRIGNPDWHKRMAAATDVQKAAEQLMIDALSLRIQRDAYIAQLQTNVLLGRLLQDSLAQRYQTLLDAQRKDLEDAMN